MFKKKVYLGLSNGTTSVANKTKEIYIGVNGVAHRIKRGYIGINGIAHLFYSYLKTVSKLNNIGNLATGKHFLGGTSTESHAIFAGGNTGGSTSTYSKTVELFDIDCISTSTNNLTTAKSRVAAEKINNIAVFAGGQSGSSTYNAAVNAYNDAGTSVTVSGGNLGQARRNIAAAALDEYIFFGGGCGANSTTYTNVDVYDTSLVKPSTTCALTTKRAYLAAGRIGNFVLFGGGYTGSADSAVIDAFSNTLVRSSPTALGVARDTLAAATAGKCIIFLGGDTTFNDSFSSAIDIYNDSLVRTLSESSLSGVTAKYSHRGVSMEEHALFCGGNTSSGGIDEVNVFNDAGVLTTNLTLSVSRVIPASAYFNSRAFIAGGNNTTNNTYSATIDIFEEE